MFRTEKETGERWRKVGLAITISGLSLIAIEKLTLFSFNGSVDSLTVNIFGCRAAPVRDAGTSFRELGRVGPFQTGAAAPESAFKDAFARSLDETAESLDRNAARLIGVFIVGSTDKRNVRAKSGLGFESNFSLASARSDQVEASLAIQLRRLGVPVFNSTVGGRGYEATPTNDEDLRRDRFVYVYGLTTERVHEPEKAEAKTAPAPQPYR
jgi:hypothetical protein